MLTYRLEDRGSLPLYEYLYRCIRSDILAGRIRSGEKLPSKRSLAEHLDISVITVENAYAQLITEGYVVSREKRGFFVEELPLSADLPESSRKRTPARRASAEAAPAVIADFTSNSVDASLFPFSSWSRVMRKVLTDRKQGLLDRAPMQGIPELREELSRYLLRFRGMNVRPDQIFIGAGTEYLYGMLITLLGADRTYAVENPGYNRIREIYRSRSITVREIPVDSQGLSVADLERSDASVVHLSPSHHFPTGTVMPIGRRQELLRWAYKKPERFILEDDYDSEFRFDRRPLPPLAVIDNGGRVIYMNTFSKTLTPSIRISYMVLPEALLSLCRERLGFCSCTVSNFEQYALAEFIAGGYYEHHLNRMRTACRRRRNELLQAIHEGIPDLRFRILEEDAGLHFLLKLDTPLSDSELKRKAAGLGIRISCLSDYYSGEAPEGTGRTLIMNYSGLTSDSIAEGVRRLAQLVESPEEEQTDRH